MNNLYYKLDNDKNIIVCKDVLEWARSFEGMDRHVKDTLTPNFRISTVFIGIDMSFRKEGDNSPPLLFETMVFATKDLENEGEFTGHDSYCERYATYEEASLGHDRIFNQIINNEIELKTRKKIKLTFKLPDNEETSTG